MCLCWRSSSLHRYLSSLWALSWAFSNVIWAAAFTCYIYLDASWCSICVCLSSFWAWFWGFPTGIWAIPCSKKHTQTYVYLCWCSSSLHRYLSSLWAAAFTYYIYLDASWCPICVCLSFLLSFPQWSPSAGHLFQSFSQSFTSVMKLDTLGFTSNGRRLLLIITVTLTRNCLRVGLWALVNLQWATSIF